MRWWIFAHLVLTGLQALPMGMELVHGKAHASSAQIETEGKTVLSWESFSLTEGESLHFAQTGQNPAVLNRVRGSEPSRLFGALTSNGEVFLVNPHGILVGKQGRVETAGFIASTLDLENSLFLAGGALPLQGASSASIVHEGEIVCKGGRVLLSAHGIESRGRIEAGSIALIASETVWLQPEGAERQFFQESLEKKENPSWIQLSGTLQANRMQEGGKGEIQLLADTVFVEKEAHLSLNGEKNGDGGSVWILGNERADFFGTISARGGEEAGDGGFAEVSAPLLEYRGVADLRAPKGKFGTLLLDPSDVVISGGDSTPGVDLSTDPATLPAGNSVNIRSSDIAAQLQLSNVTITTVGTSGSGSSNGYIWLNQFSDIGAGGSWSAATTLSLIAASYIHLRSAIINTGATTGFTAVSLTGNGIDASAPAISLSSGLGSITTNGGDIVITGTANAALSSANAVNLFSAITTTTGSITITGNVPPGPTGESYGIDMIAGNIFSTSGDITLTGTTASSGDNSAGVRLSNSFSWNTGSTGALRFLNCSGSDTANFSNGVSIFPDVSITHPGDLFFTNCVGGEGSDSSTQGGHGVSYLSAATLSVGGNLTATGLVGKGNGGHGFFQSAGLISVNGAGSEISITASAAGTTGFCNGILIRGSQIRTTGGGSLSFNGTGGLGLGFGIQTFLSGAEISTTGGGDIFLTGTGRGTGASHGISFGVANSFSSDSGHITLSGTGNAEGIGVFITTAQAPGTTGSLSFSNCQGGGDAVFIAATITQDGPLIFSNCIGGVSGGHGVHIVTSPVLTGDVLGTGLEARGAGSSGFYLNTDFSTSGSISITASASGTEGDCSGIILRSGILSTSSGGSITLNGTGGPSDSNSHGIFLDLAASPRISTTTGNGNIFLTGSAQGSGITSSGIMFLQPDAIVSTSGNITLTGITTGSGSNSKGVDVFSDQNTLTSGTLTFLNCAGSANATNSDAVNVGFSTTITHAGDLTFTDCVGGDNGVAGGHGLYALGSLEIGGNVLATGLQGQGYGGVGLRIIRDLSVSGAGKSISITASATGTTGPCYGIYLAHFGTPQGTISTTGGGSITLIGTGGPSSSPSHGITMIPGLVPLVSTTTGNGNIFLIGSAQGPAASDGILITGPNSATSTSGNITLTGTTTATGSGALGVNIAASSWNMETAGVITVNSPGGPIVLGEALTLTGDVDFNTGAGTGSFSAGTITGNYAMTVTTGTATFNGAVGSPTPLVSIAVNANSINVNGAHTVTTGPMQYNGPVALLGTQVFTNQGALPIAFSSSITGNFPLTIVSDNGAVSVAGAVNTSGAQGSSITVDAAGNILFSSPIEAVSSDGSAGGEVRLISSGGTVTVDAITN